MATGLQSEQENYQKLVENLDKLSEGDNKEASIAAQGHGQDLIDNYTKELSVNGVFKLRNWEAETPEEIETLERCLRVKPMQRTTKNIFVCTATGLMASCFTNCEL